MVHVLSSAGEGGQKISVCLPLKFSFHKSKASRNQHSRACGPYHCSLFADLLFGHGDSNHGAERCGDSGVGAHAALLMLICS